MSKTTAILVSIGIGIIILAGYQILKPTPKPPELNEQSTRPPEIELQKPPEQKVNEAAAQFERRKTIFEANLNGLIYADAKAIEDNCNKAGWKVVTFDVKDVGKGTVKMSAGGVAAEAGRDSTQNVHWEYITTQRQCLGMYLKKLATDDAQKVTWTSDLDVGHDSGELSAFNTVIKTLADTYKIDIAGDPRTKAKREEIDQRSYAKKAEELNSLKGDVIISREFTVTRPPLPTQAADFVLHNPHPINEHKYTYNYLVYLDSTQLSPDAIKFLTGQVGKPTAVPYTVWGSARPILTKGADGKVVLSGELQITPMAVW